FTQDAYRAVARQAIERKIGARGLRNVLEGVMLEIMFSLPDKQDIQECIINADVIEKGKPPLLLPALEVQSAAGE
ncbi:MAG: ATP-dependent Clp protease ATP-binding subunit ClpX, partial [Desulfovibrionaceae bacterium]|nr:ATP-dependent Clp protease ATP-binding subunit ClpX [Desulfovibrionaceae bacterium]